MNERNVEALGKLIQEFWESDADSLQEWLASRGVLVPSTLTDLQAAKCMEPTSQPMVAMSLLRERLDHIAKGE